MMGRAPLLLCAIDSERTMYSGNPANASEKLGWRAKFRMRDVVRLMVDVRAPAGI
jgi:GDP-D-mannose dehydratase